MALFAFTRIIHAGLEQDLPAHLHRKVVPTNIITLLLLFVIAIPFVIISLLFLPKELAFYPGLGGVICIGVLIMNYFGGIYYSRLVISILPISLGAIYNAYLSGQADGPIPSLYLIELSFALIPFVIFDLKEKGFLIFTSLVCLMLITSFPITKNWFNIEADSSILRDGWLGTVTIFLAIISEFGCVAGLAILNRQSEQHSENLLKDMDEKNRNLKISEVELKENLKKIEEAQLEEQKRNWASEGITQLSKILRTSHKDSASVYDTIITQLVTYVKANQGGLYVVRSNEDNADQHTIGLAACYAYSRKKYVQQEYAPGQGLIGQAYLEKEYIYMTNVPADYIKITSGLGESTPRAILIMPMKINDTMEGMLELASFHPFELHVIQFIEKISESIASFIQSNRINENTTALLTDSRHKAEELRAQEEEMRQNVEELAATQEEMIRKENEYLKKIEGLEELVHEAKELQEKEQELHTKINTLEELLLQMSEREKLYQKQIDYFKQVS